jgi:hypothetical protein
MNQNELEKYISKDYITWESIKLTLLSPDNSSTISKNFSDDSVILDGVIIFNNSKGAPIPIANNEFLVLLTSSSSGQDTGSDPFSYDLTNNQATVIGSTIGSIFTKTIAPSGIGFGTASFLLFRVN